MEMEVEIKQIYKHYKGNYYIVEDIATDSETLEDIVIYRALYDEKKLWARPYSSFIEEVNKGNQIHRFEKQNIENRSKHMLTYKKITKEYEKQLFELIDTVLSNIPDGHFIPYEEWELNSMFDEKNYAPLYGAFDGEKLVGMAQLYVSQDMMAGFKKDFDLENYTVCELGGNLVLPEYRGNGITTTLQKMELELAKELDFDYIISMAHPDNIASQKTLEKVGLKFYKTMSVANGFLRNLYMLKLK